MDKELNLCELLKGHEGETFYCSLSGDNVRLHSVSEYDGIRFKSCAYSLNSDGTYIEGGEKQLFPSKDQRDWGKWAEQNKTPKTWSELVKIKDTKDYFLEYHATKGFDYEITNPTPIEKSALALLKIHQLIEVSYGGNVTSNEWSDDTWKFIIGRNVNEKEFHIMHVGHEKSLIAFHKIEQAKEFLSYPENVQLLKDYYMA